MEHFNQNYGKQKGITSRACSKCGGDLGHRYGRQRYCLTCHAEYMRKHRPKHKDLPEVARMKANARATAKMAVRNGQIKRDACLICGSQESEMHHEDYSKPLEVIWVCRPCHLGHHFGTATGHTLNHVLNLLARADLLIRDHA